MPGDQLHFVKGRIPISLEISAMPLRRGPASEAQIHYTLFEQT